MVEKKQGHTQTIYATGRRKCSIARVWLDQGSSEIVVNGRKLETHFPRETLRMMIDQPFEATKTKEQYGVRALVRGGGLTGQAGAVRLGIARALVGFDENHRTTLRRGGFLTRDPRKKERKKYGQKGARRAFQFTKR
jgi:small subunit ribosomal protein S9